MSDLLRFGRAIQNQGTLIDFLVGSACEVMAVRQITNILSGLNAEDCKRAARVLERHEATREPLEAIARRETEWSWRTFGLLARARMMIQARSLRPGKEWEIFLPDTKGEYNSRARAVRITLLKLVVRAFELERGHKPQAVGDLIPEFILVRPIDVESKRPLELP